MYISCIPDVPVYISSDIEEDRSIVRVPFIQTEFAARAEDVFRLIVQNAQESPAWNPTIIQSQVSPYLTFTGESLPHLHR